MSNRLTAGELIDILETIDPDKELFWQEEDYDTNGYFTRYLKSVTGAGYLVGGDSTFQYRHEEDFEDEDD